MGRCPYCSKNCPTETDHASGIVSCAECGKVLYQDIFSEETEFVKGPGGESRAAGNRVFQSEYSDSYRRTLEKGKTEIHHLIVQLTSEGNESLETQASRFYKIAVERGFTRGRRTPHVAASCLYISCRMNEQPYLLIDFAMLLTVNVYVLGAVFLQLCKLLSLGEHPVVQKLVDRSLFMHRFSSRLMKGDFQDEVLHTALNIVASMKRDWMQTGRKPSGICGAALYISALSYGFTYSRSDILRVVHICEATLTRRLIEFEGTTSGSLTIEELNQKAQEYKKENHSNTRSRVAPKGNETKEVLCQHKGEAPCFAHGLCRNCYQDFIDISGGLDGEAEPPSFQRAEMHRLVDASFCKDKGNTANGSGCCDEEMNAMDGNGYEDTLNPTSTSAKKPEMHYSDKFEKPTYDPNVTDEDNLSDIVIDEEEYLHSKQEINFRKRIWDILNKDYVEEQAAKEAAAASKDFGATEAELAKKKEKKRQKRAMDAKNAVPPKTPAEATWRMLEKKGYSSKFNFAELQKILAESDEIPDINDDTCKEKQKDENDDIEQEENEEDVEEDGEYNVGDEGYYGEEGMYNYDDYDPGNNVGD